jgi:hypothetical protein
MYKMQLNIQNILEKPDRLFLHRYTESGLDIYIKRKVQA